MKKKITILGAGQVGRAMAIDLCKDYEVTSADASEKSLALLEPFPVKKIKADLSRTYEIHKVIADSELVIGAVPGFMGFEMVKTVISTGKNIVDISFFNEDAFELDALAKEKNVTVVVDCGVAPGMDNIILGYHNKRMEVHSFECLVGGLPVKREWPFEYKAPFSPIDVIAEYTRPARFVKDGMLVTRPALSDPEIINFPEAGNLQAFNTDGLRSLVKTMKIPNMIERTLRYPGHIELMKVFRETGFFSEEAITVNDVQVRPIDVTAKLLFPKWKLEPDEEEFTIMRVTVNGEEGQREKQYVYNLFDTYDKETKTSSMARTTGYTCTAVARLVIENQFTRKGICPPEYVGEEEKCFRYVLEYLKERNIHYKFSEKV